MADSRRRREYRGKHSSSSLTVRGPIWDSRRRMSAFTAAGVIVLMPLRPPAAVRCARAAWRYGASSARARHRPAAARGGPVRDPWRPAWPRWSVQTRRSFEFPPGKFGRDLGAQDRVGFPVQHDDAADGGLRVTADLFHHRFEPVGQRAQLVAVGAKAPGLVLALEDGGEGRRARLGG